MDASPAGFSLLGSGGARSGATRKVQLGNLGDVAPVGNGVYEMREHFGPGWRMYYVQRGDVLIVMLGGGDKSTQQADIGRAIALAESMED